MNLKRLFVLYLGAGLIGYLVIILPVVFLLTPVIGYWSSVVGLLCGVIVGGLAGPIVLMTSERAQRWVGW